MTYQFNEGDFSFDLEEVCVFLEILSRQAHAVVQYTTFDTIFVWNNGEETG